MFKPAYGICICHNEKRLIVVKAGYCKIGNDERKGKTKVNVLKQASLKNKNNLWYGHSEGINGGTIRQGIQRKPTSVQKVHKPIPKRSDKRKKQEVAYQALRNVYLSTHPECEANIPGVCSGEPSHEIHHEFSGRDREKYFLDTSTWKAVERRCHDWIHLHPIEAREMGLLK